MIDDKLYTVSALIVVIIIYAAYCIQESSKKCNYVFRYPDTSLVTNWLPGYPGGAGFYNRKKPENFYYKKDKSENLDPVNDRVNTHGMSISFAQARENMGDITGGLWQSVKSEPMVSNDGMLTYDAGAYEQMTPEYLNQEASSMNELMVTGGMKSRLEGIIIEKPDAQTPWSS